MNLNTNKYINRTFNGNKTKQFETKIANKMILDC